MKNFNTFWEITITWQHISNCIILFNEFKKLFTAEINGHNNTCNPINSTLLKLDKLEFTD